MSLGVPQVMPLQFGQKVGLIPFAPAQKNAISIKQIKEIVQILEDIASDGLLKTTGFHSKLKSGEEIFIGKQAGYLAKLLRECQMKNDNKLKQAFLMSVQFLNTLEKIDILLGISNERGQVIGFLPSEISEGDKNLAEVSGILAQGLIQAATKELLETTSEFLEIMEVIEELEEVITDRNEQTGFSPESQHKNDTSIREGAIQILEALKINLDEDSYKRAVEFLELVDKFEINKTQDVRIAA